MLYLIALQWLSLRGKVQQIIISIPIIHLTYKQLLLKQSNKIQEMNKYKVYDPQLFHKVLFQQRQDSDESKNRCINFE
ncbi:hypothetical protein FGO68_gene4118 [Halteria grandinella]|uniref:Uncharacterized protein n=1 Tax=Halteria grandinella TaxID=5974 RepID=A0A8J8SY53_HALGN|nr:hypothetical protein FGO68_gene4118 [Halteria grandinella]